MELVVLKSDLLKAISATQNMVAKRSTMPILSNFLLSASDEKLEVFGSDLEMSALARVSAKVKKAGSTTVNARLFGDVVRELPEAEVKILVGANERLEISCLGSKFKLVGVSASEFPSLPGMSLKAMVKVPAAFFADVIATTLYSASQDETRFNLNGVCFEPADNSKTEKGKISVRFVATDGHRMSMVTRSINNFGVEGKVIVPRRGLLELKKLLAGSESEVGICLQEGFFLVETEELKIAMRLIDGEFPDCSQVLPKTEGFKAVIRGSDLAAPLRRMMLMVSDKEKGVRMSFGDNELQVASSSPNLGEAAEKVVIEYQGKAMTAGVNAQYLIETAQAFGEDTQIQIELFGELAPLKISRKGDDSAIAIVMPMRL